MAILGNIIKGVINLKDTFSNEIDHIEAQNNVLEELLNKAKDTQFGEFYNFPELLNSKNIAESFSQNVPFFDYNKINDEWWHKLHNGERDVTWPGAPSYYALSSGTTGTVSYTHLTLPTNREV